MIRSPAFYRVFVLLEFRRTKRTNFLKDVGMVSVNPKRHKHPGGVNRASSCPCFGIRCAWRHSAVITSCQICTLKIPGILKTHCTVPLGFTGQRFFKPRRFFLRVYVQEKMSMARSFKYVGKCKKRCIYIYIATQEVCVHVACATQNICSIA